MISQEFACLSGGLWDEGVIMAGSQMEREELEVGVMGRDLIFKDHKDDSRL